MEGIADVYYRHAKKVFKEFKINNLYHNLYVQSDIYYLKMYLRILEINLFKYMNLILLIFYQHLD